MNKSIRKVGIDLIGEAPWGTHLCLFYQTQSQLIEVLATYFLAGVENNEYCVWMVAEPLTVRTAGKALCKQMKRLTPYLKQGQIEILDHRPWQLDNGNFDPKAMFQGLAEMERQAIQKDFDGLRMCGDMGWIEDEDWAAVTEYERLVDCNATRRQILALCAYSKENIGTSKVFDLISSHQLGLIQRAGKWEMITSSENKPAKEALNASEDRYEALVRSSLHHMFMLSREGIYLESNDLVDHFGLKNGEALTGLSLNNVYPPEIAEAYAQQLERVLATGLAVEFEHPMSTQGDEHEYLVTLYPIYRFGEIEAVGGISRDITETRRAERAVRQAEERYHAIYENAVEGIFQSTQDGRFLSVNLAMARIFGYASSEEMLTTIGNDIDSRIYVNPERRTEFIGALMADGVVTEFENQNYRKDGSIIWTHTNARAVRDSKGELLYFEGFLSDITERKRAEEARMEIENRIQSFIEKTDAGYFFIDRDGRFQQVNEAWLRMHGFASADEVVGQHFAITQVDADVEQATANVKKLLEGEPIPVGESSRRCKDGSIGYHTFSAMPVVQGGEVIGLEGFIIDTTERMRFEEALRESEDRHRDLVENLHEFICTHDLKGKILSANTWASKALGYDLNEILGKNLADFLTPESQGRFPAYLDAVQKKGTMQGLLSVKTRSGETRIWEYKNSLRTQGVATPIVRGMAIDVTERLRAEEALRESEVRFRTLASVASAGIYLTDAYGKCQYVNPRWCQMAGLEREEALGNGWGKSVHPEDREWMMQKMIYYQGRMEEWNYEYRFLKPDGTVTWVSGVSAPIVDQSGQKPNQIIGYVGVNLDITERKQMETQLRVALAEKEVLLREVHHRVKNNLATISSLLELQARASQDARVQSAFQESQQRIRSMTQIHEQLYRSESLSHIDMSHYAAGLADELRYIYAKGEVAVQVDVQKVRLTIDQAIPCGLIINELVTNALKYAFSVQPAVNGGIDLAAQQQRNQVVSVLLHSTGDHCLLKVSDNGRGMPAEMDINNTKTLGLRLVSRLAMQLGGELNVESDLQTPASGTVFQIVFPIMK